MSNTSTIRVSAYVKGDENTPDYYRIHQYLKRIEGIKVSYHLMLPARLYHKYMPIRRNNIVVVVLLFLMVYCRTVWNLLKDLIVKPDVIIINRRIMPFRTLFPIWHIVKLIKKKHTRIIWDFDDDIISLGECNASDFRKLSGYSSTIIVTHQYLASLVDEENRHKINILPTTDGDMYHIIQTDDVNRQRLQHLKEAIRLVWVATSANLPFLESAISCLDKAAERVKSTLGKPLILQVVCNAPLHHHCCHLRVENIVWSRKATITAMKGAHIGIMPLTDTDIAKGKGGFKLVQYMSVGLPCIATDVGFNNKVIDENCGRLIPVEKPEQWIDSILALADEEEWKRCSTNAQKTWELHFSFEKNLTFWKQLLLSNNA